MRGFDAVVHLAELSNDPLGQHNPELTYQINHLGTVELAKKSYAQGFPDSSIPRHAASTASPMAETTKPRSPEPNPQTAYARCKVLVERDLSALASDNFSPTFLRNATAYGPSPRMRFDLVLNNLGGFCLDHKTNQDDERWQPLASVGSRPRHRPCHRLRPGSSETDQFTIKFSMSGRLRKITRSRKSPSRRRCLSRLRLELWQAATATIAVTE